ncbi:MAG TPA: sensor histidine kinase, partial [Advenella sp.]|nr:sensor histidine kinase [Advenella sp.]
TVPAESSDPLAAVYTAAEQLQASYPDFAKRVLIKAEGAIPCIKVARPLLLSATQNLIDNALRYTPDDKPITVQITQPGAGRIRISVLDEGPGLNAYDRAHAVNRFWRRDRSVPGSGLGLSIVDAIARRHHGTFELLQRAGPGLEARLEFPI